MSAADQKQALMHPLSSSAGFGCTFACELDAAVLRSSCIKGKVRLTALCG